MRFADCVTGLPQHGLGSSTDVRRAGRAPSASAAGRAGDGLGLGSARRRCSSLPHPDGGDVPLEALDPGLAALLERAADEALLGEARRHGAEAGEDAEIVARLIGDGLLR